MSFPGSQYQLCLWKNVHTRPKGSDGHQDTWYGEILKQPIANIGVWDGALTCVNEENGVMF